MLNTGRIPLIKETNTNNLPLNISSWLYRVTRNKIVDYYRAKHTVEELPEELSIETESISVIKQLSACLLPMINALPDIFQQPLTLSEIDGKKYIEIASELNLTVPAVKSRILRGREKLRKNMTACCKLYQNNSGNIINFEQKDRNACSDCHQ